MSSCKETEPLIQLLLDGELNEIETKRVKDHINSCMKCRKQAQEMILLFHSLDEIGMEERIRQRRLFMIPAKWIAVCMSVSFLLLLSPIESKQAEEESLPLTSVKQIGQENSKLWDMLVLATTSEKLHIPKNDSLQVVQPMELDTSLQTDTAWVYPSAMPFFQKGDQSWMNRINRLILVKVPDHETFQTFLSSTGIQMESEEWGDRELNFPVSIIIQKGDQTHFETFHFPDNESGVTTYFEKFAAQDP
ncbi:anti-sigma factor family protein [Hazenella coriacea]|nr:zf-HC2 domain-containing protein [Hazenella coriacea]